MSEKPLPNELYMWRKYGVKVPPAKPVPAGGVAGVNPMDVTATPARDLLLGLVCYGFLCGGLGLIIGYALWVPR